MLFPSLSVMEHLIFFGMVKKEKINYISKHIPKLKGLSMSEAKADGQKYIDMLSFNPKKNVASSALSGGMKRKLHLAMALTGSSKVCNN